MTADQRADWLALRDWLIKTRGNAQLYARQHQKDPSYSMAFESQVEVLTSALDFMDERERAS